MTQARPGKQMEASPKAPPLEVEWKSNFLIRDKQRSMTSQRRCRSGPTPAESDNWKPENNESSRLGHNGSLKVTGVVDLETMKA